MPWEETGPRDVFVAGRESWDTISLDIDCLQEKQSYLAWRNWIKVEGKGVVREEPVTKKSNRNSSGLLSKYKLEQADKDSVRGIK